MHSLGSVQPLIVLDVIGSGTVVEALGSRDTVVVVAKVCSQYE